MLDTISQFVIPILGTASIILIARKNKWGLVVGLLNQPFWIATSYLNEQWGAFAVSFVYTASWIYGIYEWFKEERRTSH